MSVAMYQENILDHYEHPYHRGALETPTLDYPYSDISTEMFEMPLGVFFIGCIPYKESRDVSRLSYPTTPRCPAQL